MSLDDWGTAAYTTGIATSTAASALSPDPMLRFIAAAAGAAMGTMLSSPSDIGREADKTRATQKSINAAGQHTVTAVTSAVAGDKWENMGRDEMLTVIGKHQSQATDTGEILGEMAKVLDNLRLNSGLGALASATVGPVLFACAVYAWVRAAFPVGNLILTGSGITNAPATQAARTVTEMAKKFLLVYASAGTLAAGMAWIISSRVDAGSASAVQHATADPTFQQAFIPDLPEPKKAAPGKD